MRFAICFSTVLLALTAVIPILSGQNVSCDRLIENPQEMNAACGRLIDSSTGKPIKGAVVTLRRPLCHWIQPELSTIDLHEIVAMAKTDAAGVFDFRKQNPGIYIMKIQTSESDMWLDVHLEYDGVTDCKKTFQAGANVR